MEGIGNRFLLEIRSYKDLTKQIEVWASFDENGLRLFLTEGNIKEIIEIADETEQGTVVLPNGEVGKPNAFGKFQFQNDTNEVFHLGYILIFSDALSYAIKKDYGVMVDPAYGNDLAVTFINQN